MRDIQSAWDIPKVRDPEHIRDIKNIWDFKAEEILKI